MNTAGKQVTVVCDELTLEWLYSINGMWAEQRNDEDFLFILDEKDVTVNLETGELA